MANETTVPVAILQQLGRAALFMMGAKNMVIDATSLQFKIAGSPKATHVKITLDPSDTYTVEFTKVRKFNVTPVASVSCVYADQLHKIIESNTGLYLSI